MYIYKIQNKTNNKIYIGSSINYEQRVLWHKRDLENKTHHNIHLQEDYNNSSLDNFDFSIIYIFDETPSKLTLLKKEKEYLLKQDKNKLYNIDLTILDVPNKKLSLKNKRYKRSGNISLSNTILKYSKFKIDFLKALSTDYKIPYNVILKTVDSLIKSGKLSIKEDTYYKS